MRNTHIQRHVRRGSMIIEVVVASLLFATALVALGRLAQTSTSLNVQSDRRLSAKLTAENAISRLKNVEFDDVNGELESIEKQLSESSALSVQIQTQAFEVQGQDAMKMAVHVADESGLIDVTLHDWRSKPSGKQDEEKPDEEKQDEENQDVDDSEDKDE